MITQAGGLENAQELSLNFHGHPWMALFVETVKPRLAQMIRRTGHDGICRENSG